MTRQWIYAECFDCHAEFQYYMDGSVSECPECGSQGFEVFPESDDCCNCREKVGMRMKTYSVEVAFFVDVEMQVNAANEEEAEAVAISEIERRGIENVLRDSDFVSFSDPEVVASWELDNTDPSGDEIVPE